MTFQPKYAVLVALLLTLLLAGVTPASAGDVTVGVVAATQFDSGLFVALVSATGVNHLIDAQLVVNNTPVVPDSIDSYALSGPNNATLFKFVSYTKVAKPGDTLTAVVTDINGATGIRTVVCGRGLTGLHITTICR